MASLLVLAVVLLALWGWGMVERDRSAAFMGPWVNVLFITGMMALVMAIGLAVREWLR